MVEKFRDAPLDENCKISNQMFFKLFMQPSSWTSAGWCHDLAAVHVLNFWGGCILRRNRRWNSQCFHLQYM